MKILAIAITALLVAGCSSAPKSAGFHPQYCYTSQTIVTKNGESVNSQTVVECTDDQIKRVTENRLGMARNCGTFNYWTKQGGVDVQRKGVSCQKLDGSWEIVNTGR